MSQCTRGIQVERFSNGCYRWSQRSHLFGLLGIHCIIPRQRSYLFGLLASILPSRLRAFRRSSQYFDFVCDININICCIIWNRFAFFSLLERGGHVLRDCAFPSQSRCRRLPLQMKRLLHQNGLTIIVMIMLVVRICSSHASCGTITWNWEASAVLSARSSANQFVNMCTSLWIKTRLRRRRSSWKYFTGLSAARDGNATDPFSD